MKYSKLDAKDYARENMKGIWAAAFEVRFEGLRRRTTGRRSPESGTSETSRATVPMPGSPDWQQ